MGPWPRSGLSAVAMARLESECTDEVCVDEDGIIKVIQVASPGPGPYQQVPAMDTSSSSVAPVGATDILSTSNNGASLDDEFDNLSPSSAPVAAKIGRHRSRSSVRRAASKAKSVAAAPRAESRPVSKGDALGREERAVLYEVPLGSVAIVMSASLRQRVVDVSCELYAFVATCYGRRVVEGGGAGAAADPVVTFQSGVLPSHTVQRAIEHLEDCEKVPITTPTFINFFTTFIKFVREKKRDIVTQRRRYQGGLKRLYDAQASVADMKSRLEELQPELMRTSRETEKLMETITSQRRDADIAKASVGEDETAAMESAKVAQTIRDECESELQKVLPALRAALRAVDSLNKTDVHEIKVFKHPPRGVKLVMEAICIMKAIRPIRVDPRVSGGRGKPYDDYWDPARKLLSDTKFLPSLLNYDLENIPPEIIEKVQPYVENEAFNPMSMMKVSRAAASLSAWVLATVQFYDVYQVVHPKRQALEEADSRLQASLAELDMKKEALCALQEHLEQLQVSYEKALSDQREIEGQIQMCERQYDNAHELIDRLSGEQSRWADMVQRLTRAEHDLVGNALLSAGFVGLLAPFSLTVRRKTLRLWEKTLRAYQIPFSTGSVANSDSEAAGDAGDADKVDDANDVDDAGVKGASKSSRWSITSVMSDPAQLREWRLLGLPDEPFSFQSAVALNVAALPVYLVDPQGQGVTFLRARYGDRLQELRVCSRDMLPVIAECVSEGRPILVPDSEEDMDPVLYPLLRSEYIGARACGIERGIQIGGAVIAVHPDFKLFVATTYNRVVLTPNLVSMMNVVNFSITSIGLKEQVLSLVFSVERPDLEQKKNSLVVKNQRNRVELSNLEDEILDWLRCIDHILDDSNLLKSLTQAKKTADDIAKQLVVMETTQKDLDTVRAVYAPVATVVCALYYAVQKLDRLDHIFTFSLTWFLNHLRNAMGLAARPATSRNVPMRVLSILSCFIRQVYVELSEAMFNDDQLLLRFHITTALLSVQHSPDCVEKRVLDYNLLSYILSGRTIRQQNYVPLSLNCDAEQAVQSVLNDTQMSAVLELQHIPCFYMLLESIASVPAVWKAWLLSPEQPLPVGTWTYRPLTDSSSSTGSGHSVDHVSTQGALAVAQDQALLQSSRELFTGLLPGLITGTITMEDVERAVESDTGLADGGTAVNSQVEADMCKVALVRALKMPYLPAALRLFCDKHVPLLATTVEESRASKKASRDAERSSATLAGKERKSAAVLKAQKPPAAPSIGAASRSVKSGGGIDTVGPGKSSPGTGATAESSVADLSLSVGPTARNLAQVAAACKPNTPILLFMNSAVDPTAEVFAAAGVARMGQRLRFVSLGRGQVQAAIDMITSCAQLGYWCVLQNAHLVPQSIHLIENAIIRALAGSSFDRQAPETDGEGGMEPHGGTGVDVGEAATPTIRPLNTVHDDFRLWITSKPVSYFPPALLQRSAKYAFEPPGGVRARMLRVVKRLPRTVGSMLPVGKLPEFFRQLFGLCLFHAVVGERSSFGPLGWSKSYEFSDSDLLISVQHLEQYIEGALALSASFQRSESVGADLLAVTGDSDAEAQVAEAGADATVAVDATNAEAGKSTVADPQPPIPPADDAAPAGAVPLSARRVSRSRSRSRRSSRIVLQSSLSTAADPPLVPVAQAAVPDDVDSVQVVKRTGWEGLHFLLGELNYGGRVSEGVDRLVVRETLKLYVNSSMVCDGVAQEVKVAGGKAGESETRSLSSKQLYVHLSPGFVRPVNVTSVDNLEEFVIQNFPSTGAGYLNLFGLHENSVVGLNNRVGTTVCASMMKLWQDEMQLHVDEQMRRAALAEHRQRFPGAVVDNASLYSVSVCDRSSDTSSQLSEISSLVPQRGDQREQWQQLGADTVLSSDVRTQGHPTSDGSMTRSAGGQDSTLGGGAPAARRMSDTGVSSGSELSVATPVALPSAAPAAAAPRWGGPSVLMNIRAIIASLPKPGWDAVELAQNHLAYEGNTAAMLMAVTAAMQREIKIKRMIRKESENIQEGAQDAVSTIGPLALAEGSPKSLTKVLERKRVLRVSLERATAVSKAVMRVSPMAMVCVRELDMYRKLVSVIRESLTGVELVLQGDYVQSDGIDRLLESIRYDKLPAVWQAHTPQTCLVLSRWFMELSLRCRFMIQWANSGRPPPIMWASALYSFDAFLVAIRREYARVVSVPLAAVELETIVVNETMVAISAVTPVSVGNIDAVDDSGVARSLDAATPRRSLSSTRGEGSRGALGASARAPQSRRRDSVAEHAGRLVSRIVSPLGATETDPFHAFYASVLDATQGDGACLRGLYIEGAVWNSDLCALDDPTGDQSAVAMPFPTLFLNPRLTSGVQDVLQSVCDGTGLSAISVLRRVVKSHAASGKGESADDDDDGIDSEDDEGPVGEGGFVVDLAAYTKKRVVLPPASETRVMEALNAIADSGDNSVGGATNDPELVKSRAYCVTLGRGGRLQICPKTRDLIVDEYCGTRVVRPDYVFLCPVFLTSERKPAELVCRIPLPSLVPEGHWILRGAALVLSPAA